MGRKERKENKKRSDGSAEAEDGGARCRGWCFPLLVALLQLLLGVAVAAVAFLMLAVSPSLLTRETPHWAGIIMVIVSILGLILYCVTYIPDERTSLQFIVKLLYFILCVIGLVISVLVIAFSGHHYSLTAALSCVQEAETEECVCTLEPADPLARAFVYGGVSDCEAVTGTLTHYFLLQMVLNLAQALVCAAAAFIMWKDCYQVFFAGLQIAAPSAQQWQKV